MVAKNGWEVKYIKDPEKGYSRLARILYKNGKRVEQHWIDPDKKSNIPEVQLLIERNDLLNTVNLLKEEYEILEDIYDGEITADEDEAIEDVDKTEHEIINKIPKSLLIGINEDYLNGQTLLWDPEGEELRQRITKYYKLPEDTFKFKKSKWQYKEK